MVHDYLVEFLGASFCLVSRFSFFGIMVIYSSTSQYVYRTWHSKTLSPIPR